MAVTRGNSFSWKGKVSGTKYFPAALGRLVAFPGKSLITAAWRWVV